jgi:hypothetical protein
LTDTGGRVQRFILEDIFVFVGLITTLGCITGVLITYIKHRASQLQTPAIKSSLEEIAERLGRLENSVDATAVEVERISEAQRFTARVLTERSGAPPVLSDKPRGSTTPH